MKVLAKDNKIITLNNQPILPQYIEKKTPEESDINFWDYDGTLLYAWTLAELAGKTELPPLSSHDGLICQGWNWTFQDIKSVGHAVDVGAMYITDDGKTRIYIHLEEGRTSPMLSICPNGTVTVDWDNSLSQFLLYQRRRKKSMDRRRTSYAKLGR